MGEKGRRKKELIVYQQHTLSCPVRIHQLSIISPGLASRHRSTV
jgi:hypothetical protein